MDQALPSPAFVMTDRNMIRILWQNINIVTKSSTMLSNLTIRWTILWQHCSPYCKFWQYCYHIWKQYCLTILCEFSTILSQNWQFSQYRIAILLPYMVTILSKLTLRRTILSQYCSLYYRNQTNCWQYCYNMSTILSAI